MLSRGQRILNLAKNAADKDGENYDFGKEEMREEDPWTDFKKWKRSQEMRAPSCVAEENNVIINIDDGENYDFGKEEMREEDPWTDFKKWKRSQKMRAPSCVAEENNRCSSKMATTIITNTSVSWKPGPTDNDTTSSLSDDFFNLSNLPRYNSNERASETTNPEVSQKLNTKNLNTNSNEGAQIESREVTKNQVQTINRHILGDAVNVAHGVETSRRVERIWDKKDRCPYCNKDLTNFSRHLFRKHSNEESIAKILSIPKGSPKRKSLIDLLRKQGNFSIFSEGVIRPVQRPSASSAEKQITFLPCTYCKGLYKKESLVKHATKCTFNNNNTTNRNVRFASEGQTLLAFTESRQPFLNRLRLKTEVFNKMHADRISLAGKTDPIICQYAEDYLKKHKRSHITNLVSNKIRELGRLLIALQDNYNINSMLQALKPENFDKVVSAARIISGYNKSSNTFQAPSLALHMRTTLLAVCSTASTMLLKKDPIIPVTNHDEVLKDVKNFRKLVDCNWKFEMGSLALKDLTEKHSLNPQKLPITEDIILFNSYCYKVAEEASNKLQNNLQDVEAFRKLSETILVLTISLNRKRVGDVQYIKIESYNFTRNTQEDCLGILTECEKELTKNFKRIMTIGKGSKAVPILFPKKIQQYIKLMLDCRMNTAFVPNDNPFLFASIGSSSKWIDGPSVLKKYANLCGAKHPETLTSSRLRKQIATVLQILSLSEVEMEQLATFMGHTKKTHEEFYRLPQETFQTSKVAKLLLMMMDKGVSRADEGKTINEIDVELSTWGRNEVEDEANKDVDLSGELEPSTSQVLRKQNKCSKQTASMDKGVSRADESKTVNEIEVELSTWGRNEVEDEANEDVNLSGEPEPSTSQVLRKQKCSKQTASIDSQIPSSVNAVKNKTTKQDRRSRGSWTSKQKAIMLKYFKNLIKNKIVPKKRDCLDFKEKNLEMFQEKTWLQIKVFVYNTYKNN